MATVWAKTDNPEWVRRNAGNENIILVHGIERAKAESLINQLKIVVGPYLASTLIITFDGQD